MKRAKARRQRGPARPAGYLKCRSGFAKRIPQESANPRTGIPQEIRQPNDGIPQEFASVTTRIQQGLPAGSAEFQRVRLPTGAAFRKESANRWSRVPQEQTNSAGILIFSAGLPETKGLTFVTSPP
jgi:hypothetical protein